MIKCEGMVGYIFGHKYTAIYSYGVASVPPRTLELPILALQYLRKETFEGMFCSRCGHKKEC